MNPGLRFARKDRKSVFDCRFLGAKEESSSEQDDIRRGTLWKVPSTPEVEPFFSNRGPGETGWKGQVILYWLSLKIATSCCGYGQCRLTGEIPWRPYCCP